MQSSILYQNLERDVTLIDIPASIAIAQGSDNKSVLLSTAPLEEPFILQQQHHEPRKEKAKQKQAESASVDKHLEYKALIEQALATLAGAKVPAWCLPRKLMAQGPKPGKKSGTAGTDTQGSDPETELEKRLRDWSTMGESKGDDAFDFQKMMAALEAGATLSETTPDWLVSYGPDHEEPWTASFHNKETHALDLTVASTQAGGSQEYGFRIPPRSTFFLSDSTHSDAFRASFRGLTEEYMLPRHFDLILLDPPWPSGSAKRKGAYEQVGGMPYMMKMLSRMDIDNYMEHNALVSKL